MIRQREGSMALERRVDESIKRSARVHYYPSRFQEMRERLGTITAMTKLVTSGDLQSGFKKMLYLGLLTESLEQIVIDFADEFGGEVVKAAQFRLDQVRKAAWV